MTGILDIIFSRRSVRKFSDQAVSREILTDLLKAAMAAPSACNNQPWEFIAIDDPAIIDQFRAALTYGAYNAPAAIAVLYNETIGNNPGCNRFWEQDLSAATENILIAAAGMELGTVWLGTHPNAEAVARVRKILNIPTEVVPLSLIYVGYPAAPARPHTKYKDNRVHWNQY